MRTALALVLLLVFATVGSAHAAESTTGGITGTVTADAKPVGGATIELIAPSGRYRLRSDTRGHFTLLGLVPDTYSVAVTATGYFPLAESGIAVVAGLTEHVRFSLVPRVRTIATVRATVRSVDAGSESDTFTVGHPQMQAAPVSGSGLANYLAGTIQGAVASVPGVLTDPFANAIVRGGRVSDTVYDYDSVPIPQGLVAEPGGNIVGAQLPTTGVASVTTALAGYTNQGDNSLGGVVDEIPAVGTFPSQLTVAIGNGVGARFQQNSLEFLDASPDLRWRYAFAATAGSQTFTYGSGAFYPSEAATYGLALQNRGQYSIEANVHDRIATRDDLSVLALSGQAAYDLYGSPFAGETAGAFDGSHTVYPGSGDPSVPVGSASGVRGSYSVLKTQWLHSGYHSLSRVELYQSQYGSQAGGPFWDENGWPDGAISLSQRQGSREDGLSYDDEDIIGEALDVRFGAEYRTNTSFLDQIVPTADERVSSRPTLISYLLYGGTTWHVSPRVDIMGTLRYTDTHVIPSAGSIYDVGAVDPHASAVYRIGTSIFARITYDRSTVAPFPLETDRVAHERLAPEVGNDVTYSLEGGTRLRFRATLFDQNDSNLIDVLPYNFRSALQSGIVPDGVGIPTNAGALRARGAELWLRTGAVTLDANYVRAYSSSASQFAFNDLNAPAVAAGVLFPVSYIPAFESSLSYQMNFFRRRLRVTTSLSYESGYPYGNGKAVWVFNPKTGTPTQVPNDNYWDPGYNYYFLKNPAVPYDSTTNPYIGSLGTHEGDLPNTLHAPGETFVNLHLEYDVNPHWSAILDIGNLLGNDAPTSYIGNPYLIGPPGYVGGNPLYAAAYEADGGYAAPYTLGNGVPTNDGHTQSLPWTYGRAGYIPQNYPLGRSITFTLRFKG